MTLSDVARATDLPKPSVRRALYTLTCLGMAASDGRTFRLTPRIMELASAYLGSNMVSTSSSRRASASATAPSSRASPPSSTATTSS